MSSLPKKDEFLDFENADDELKFDTQNFSLFNNDHKKDKINDEDYLQPIHENDKPDINPYEFEDGSLEESKNFNLKVDERNNEDVEKNDEIDEFSLFDRY